MPCIQTICNHYLMYVLFVSNMYHNHAHIPLKVPVMKDSERHHCTLLRLYLPHRGKELKPDETTYEEHYLRGEVTVDGEAVPIKDVVINNMNRYEHDADLIDEAWTTVQQGDVLEDGWADIAPGAEELRDEERSEAVIEEFSDCEDVPELPDLEVALPVCSYDFADKHRVPIVMMHVCVCVCASMHNSFH